MPCAFLPLSFTNSCINPPPNFWLSLEFYKWTRTKVNRWVTCTETEVILELSWLHSQYSCVHLCQISSVCVSRSTPQWKTWHKSRALEFLPQSPSLLRIRGWLNGISLRKATFLPSSLPEKALPWASCPGAVKGGFPSDPGAALSCFVKNKSKNKKPCLQHLKSYIS